MDHAPSTSSPELRREVYEAFYRLTARDLMKRDVEAAAFVPPHMPVEQLFSLFLGTDHAWVRVAPDSGRKIGSVLLRRDLLQALEPTHDSYSRLSTARFRSLAHGSADCICCFHEGRVLHAVRPGTKCRDVLRLMESKGAIYLPVMEGDELVGEIGSVDLLRAAHHAYESHRAAR